MTLEEKLEEIKQNGAYNVILYFGEGVGCDDLSDLMHDRNVRIIWYPVGHLGEVRCMWNGALKDVYVFDFKTSPPTVVSNPPETSEVEGYGFYVWGVPEAVTLYLSRARV